MIVARFKVQCRPERSEEMAAAIAAVEAPSREIPGVEWTVWETSATE